jgi:SAM-dependent methyltransferase
MSFDAKGLMGHLDPRSAVRAVEDWWFDTTRHVKTTGNAVKPPKAGLAGEVRDSHIYAPVRVRNARAAIRDLPVNDLSEYTFVDLGSGKGRMLFVAAEYPFRRIIGVEFALELHDAAQKNIERFRRSRRPRVLIESVHANAADYGFPAGKLVLYLFNSFGPDVLGRTLDNLGRSLEREPRHVLVVMLWPEHSDVVARRLWLRQSLKTRRYHIFETAG